MTVNHDVSVDDSREEQRRRQTEMANELVMSGALDEVFARIDAGEPVGGQDGLLNSLLKATLERGLRFPPDRRGISYKE